MGWVDRMGDLVKTCDCWRMGKKITVFAEIPAGISGRKNCNVAIICSGRLRFAALPAQKSLSSGWQSHPCGLELEGLRAPPNYPGAFALVQQPLFSFEGFFPYRQSFVLRTSFLRPHSGASDSCFQALQCSFQRFECSGRRRAGSRARRARTGHRGCRPPRFFR